MEVLDHLEPFLTVLRILVLIVSFAISYTIPHLSGSARDDSRRTREIFEKKTSQHNGKTYHLQGWLKRFVEKVGVERSRLLLNGAGVLDIPVGTNATMVKDLADYPKHNAFETRHGEKMIYNNYSHPEDLPYFGANGEVIELPK